MCIKRINDNIQVLLDRNWSHPQVSVSPSCPTILRMISVHKVVFVWCYLDLKVRPTWEMTDQLVWLNPGSNCKIQRILSFLTSKHNIKNMMPGCSLNEKTFKWCLLNCTLEVKLDLVIRSLSWWKQGHCRHNCHYIHWNKLIVSIM